MEKNMEINMFLIEDFLPKARDIKAFFDNWVKIDNKTINFKWIDKNGVALNNIPEDRTINYQYDESLEANLKEIAKNVSINDVLFLDILLNENEIKRFDEVSAYYFVAKTAQRIIEIFKDKIKIIITSSFPEILDNLERILDLQDGGEHFDYINSEEFLEDDYHNRQLRDTITCMLKRR
ncbi:MAG: hypothetical protein A2Y21_03460 [Clostridiales bacterium GWC2_40_7]|nr:MAG: hypothetical protein A2Y21_03460 [Clostridiales bacterium GWC2_40_7]